MSQPIVNGKKPVSSKPSAPAWEAEFGDPFADPLRLPPGFKEALTEKKLECRFINIKRLQEMGGFHHHAWQPWTPARFGKIEVNDFHWGKSPDGRIIRGDLVLAVRPVQIGDRHRAQLKMKNEALSMTQKKNVAEMKKLAGRDVKVVDGFDET